MTDHDEGSEQSLSQSDVKAYGVEALKQIKQNHFLSTIGLFHIIQYELQRALNQALSEFHLTNAQYSTLYTLQKQPPLSAAEIARQRYVRPQALTQILNDLQRRGLLHREEQPGTGRVLLISLSEEGLHVFLQASKKIDQLQQNILESFSAEEKELLEKMLYRYLENLQQVTLSE